MEKSRLGQKVEEKQHRRRQNDEEKKKRRQEITSNVKKNAD
jgi:hypothetical protein